MAIKQINGQQSPDGSLYVTMSDGVGNLISSGGPISGATQLAVSSGNVAAATATATLPGVSGKTTYITGFSISGAGATAGSVVNATVTGLVGAATLTYPVAAVAGAILNNTPILIQFNPAIPANAANTAIVISCPSLGLGNLNNAVNATGYQL